MVTVLSAVQQDQIKKIVAKNQLLAQVNEYIVRQRGRLFLVGGLVRDLLQGLPLDTVDIDVEAHGVTLDQLAEILSLFGQVNNVGKSFGILKVTGSPIDFAVPRADTGGRKPTVTLYEAVSIEDALRRRDLTVNAMAIDLESFELHDPFDGLAALQQGILCTPDPQFFVQDPLRFYRVMQFIGRFSGSRQSWYPDATLQTICSSMDVSTLSKERIAAEFEKLLLLSQRPSLGIRWLRALGRLNELLPELGALCGVEQEFQWHPEGDVFEHSMQVLDAAAQASVALPRHERLCLLYAALSHDLGKAVTTQMIDGRLRSFGHEVKGVPLAQSLLRRITISKELQQTVALLVRHHMAPGLLVKANAGDAAYKRLALALAPSLNLQQLAQLAYADKRGRNGKRSEPLTDPVPAIDDFIARATEAGVLLAPEAPVLTGADLLDVIAPGPALGAAVKEAYLLQINKGITDRDRLKKLVVS